MAVPKRSVPPALVRRRRRRLVRRGGAVERHEAGDVARTAGLGATTDGRALPPAERLALHDGTRDVAVDVGVADLDALQPAVDLGLVEAVQPAGEPEGDGVLDRDRVVEVVGADHAEHRTEALGAVEPRAGLDAERTPGDHSRPLSSRPARLDEPALAGSSGREGPLPAARTAGRSAGP